MRSGGSEPPCITLIWIASCSKIPFLYGSLKYKTDSVTFHVKHVDKRLLFCCFELSNKENTSLVTGLKRVIKGYEENVIPITFYNPFNLLTSCISPCET